MPIYEYECRGCSLRFELKRRFGDNSEARCPQCQSKARRIFSSVPILFKGSGFYVTDKAAEEKNKSDSSRGRVRPADKARSKELSKKDTEESVS